MAVDVESSVVGAASAKDLFAARTVLCDGAMGTMLYSRGIFINRCFDELNLSQPEMVRVIHEEYLHAGAQIIETNTFGANAFRLGASAWKRSCARSMPPGVRIARECVTEIRSKQSMEAFVGGALGPLGVRVEPGESASADEAQAAFAAQIRALAEGGPGVGADLLIAETLPSLQRSRGRRPSGERGCAGPPADRDGYGGCRTGTVRMVRRLSRLPRRLDRAGGRRDWVATAATARRRCCA